MSTETVEDISQLVLDDPQNDSARYRDQCISAMNDQCVSAMKEVENLRRRHAELLNRCELATQEADFYRKQHKCSLSKIEELSVNQKTLQLKYEQVLSDRNKLRQDYEEIVLLREQEKLEMTKEKHSSLESAPKPASLESFNDLQRKNEDLRYNFDDLQADHELLGSKFKQIQEDNQKLKEQNDILLLQHESLVEERNALKQRCAAAIHGYQKALRDRDDGTQELKQGKQQCALAIHELEQANKLKIQMSKDIIKLREERNSALHEYKLVMSERDSVHQEIEKLQDDLGHYKDKEEKLTNDKEKIFIQKESLQHEIKAVLADRDQQLKEVHDLRSRLQIALKEKETFAKNLEDQRQEFEMLKQERNAAKKERGEAIVHRDKILKECFEVKRLFASMEVGGNDEREGFKQQFDKLSRELTNAWNQAEVAKTRRDWSFSERDKVLRESNAIKEKYSKLLKEKAAADEQIRLLTSQHDKSQKKYKEFFNEVHNMRKSLADSTTNKDNLLSSQDSAIDSDSPSYQLESVHLERASKDEDFGFQIGGGNDAPISPHDTSIFIVAVSPQSIAANKLKVNDCVIRVNNIDMTNIESVAAYQAIFGSDYLNITILRQSKFGEKSPLQRIEIRSSDDKSIGLSIDSGLHIKRIDPGSAAAEEETLSIGDKILSVNGQSTDNMTYEEAKLLLQRRSCLSLTVLKPSVSSSSSRPSLPLHIDDEKPDLNLSGKIFDVPKFPENNTNLLLSGVVPEHSRSPSAPIYMTSAQDQILANHIRSNSGIGQMSDEELKKISAELYSEVQRRQGDEVKRKNNEELKVRNSSFITAIKTEQVFSTLQPNLYPYEHLTFPFRIHTSAHSSKQSISSGSTGRYSHESFNRITPSSPRNFCRSDPLSLDTKNSNPSIGSGGRSSYGKRRKPFSMPSRYLQNPQISIPEMVQQNNLQNPIESDERDQNYSLQQYVQSVDPSGGETFDDRQYGAFSEKPNSSEVCERNYSHSSPNTSKPNSLPSYGHYKSCSSHDSVTSLEYCDQEMPMLGHIEPIHEKTLDNLFEISSQQGFSSTSRNSGRSLHPISPRSSGRSSRQRSSTSPNHSHSRKSPKALRTKSNHEEEAPRETVIEKGQYPLGITIAQGIPNGIFVTGVNEESIASKVGLKYGDQLLEYNGINLRMASYEQAALILKQSAVENTVTVLAQYNPHKMQETFENMESFSPQSPLRRTASLNIPRSKDAARSPPAMPLHMRVSSTTSSCSDHSKFNTPDVQITRIPEDDPVEEPRCIRIIRDPPSTSLGIGIIGGNSTGIYISDIQKGSSVELQPGLKCGDQILKYNAKDMCGSTLEDATLELGKPTEVADFHVQYNPPGYGRAQSERGDSFFVRAMFDRSHPPKGELLFRKGDILHVTETLYKGQLGVWRASFITDHSENEECKKTRGKIPSKGKAEQELLVRRTSGYGEEKLKGRKSLFRRSKKGSSHHGVNHSRESSDSKGDYEITSTISSGTSFALTQLSDDLVGYQYVKKYDSNTPRPVAIVGAMAEPVCDKLVVESASKFARCLPEINDSTKEMVQVNFNDGTYIDYKLSRKGDRFECITPQSIKDVIYGKSKHCLLDVNPEAIDKLSPLQVYPIIIYIKYKSFKQIKDLKDGHYIPDKISTKDAKDLFERFNKVEKDYKNHFTAVLTGNSLNNICKEIVECVQEQQQKTLWIPDDAATFRTNNQNL